MTFSALPSFALSLRARIMSLAVVPLLGLFAVIGVDYVTSQRAAEADRAYEHQRELQSISIGLRSEVSAMRIAADGFRLRKERQSEVAFRNSRDTAKRSIDTLERALASSAPDTAKAIVSSFADFSQTFESYVNTMNRIGRAEGEGVLGSVSYAGVKLRGLIGKHHGEMGSWALQMQQAVSDLIIVERDFRVHGSNTYITQNERLSANLERVVGISSVSEAAKAEINAVITDYKAQFTDWSDTVQLSDTVFNRLNAQYLILGQNIDKLQAAFESGTQTSRVEQGEINDSKRWWILAAFGSVIALSLLMSMTIGMRMSRDMKSLGNSQPAIPRSLFRGSNARTRSGPWPRC
jgi:hypothetical protein